jgi:putative ABC transport system ATP-binding protein
MTDAVVSVEHVVRRFGDIAAIDDVSFGIGPGEWVALMGPSGSGKTTLLNLLACLDRPTSGRIVIDGEEVTVLSEAERVRIRREKVGVIFQQFHLIPYLSALENVMLAQHFHSIADAREAREILARVGLDDRADHRPSQLSGGEQQRVCVARALVNRPKVLLADEPTGNLDEKSERQVLALFSELHAERMTLVLVTHAPSVGALADRRIALEHGRLAGSHATPGEAEEEIDETLERIWHLKERQELTLPRLLHGENPVGRGLLRKMHEAGLISFGDGMVEFAPPGKQRARSLVRRARLAETLFQTTLGMSRHAAEKEACRFEHVLSVAATERICTFLGHPVRCPHGHAIPLGTCCPGSRSLE